MKKLVQKLFEINDHIANGGPEVLQSFLDRVSADGWEYCGMLSDYYIFKRWEEKTTVSDTGRFENKKPENNCQQNVQCQPQFNYQYQPPYNPYPFNNYQKPYTGGYQPYGQPMGTPYGYNNHPYNPNPNAGFNNSPFNASSFGTKVDEEDSNSNPFEE